jgi:hypothetical protein
MNCPCSVPAILRKGRSETCPYLPQTTLPCFSKTAPIPPLGIGNESSPNRVGDFGRFCIGGHARCQGGGSREGPRGRIPPMAGHNEAPVLSWVRVGKCLGCRDRNWDSVFRKGFGDRCLAEARQPLRNPGCSPRFCPAMGGTHPLGGEYCGTLSTPSIGKRAQK